MPARRGPPDWGEARMVAAKLVAALEYHEHADIVLAPIRGGKALYQRYRFGDSAR